MATLHHNITGELTQELLAPGGDTRVTKVFFTNIHATTACTVDLYIAKKLTGSFYLLKSVVLPIGSTFVYSGVRFNNKTGEFGLYIKLTKGASETPAVDVIIQ